MKIQLCLNSSLLHGRLFNKGLLGLSLIENKKKLLFSVFHSPPPPPPPSWCKCGVYMSCIHFFSSLKWGNIIQFGSWFSVIKLCCKFTWKTFPEKKKKSIMRNKESILTVQTEHSLVQPMNQQGIYTNGYNRKASIELNTKIPQVSMDSKA